MDENLSKLYQAIILEYNNSPLFFEKRPDAQYVLEAYNPLCGDKFKLYLSVENERIATATFHGYGCAVSKASTSVLMKKIQGQPLDALPGLLEQFLSAIAAGSEEEVSDDPDVVAFTVAKNFPGRDKCATLSWEALKRWTVDGGRWTVDGGRWTVDGGRWTVDGGR